MPDLDEIAQDVDIARAIRGRFGNIEVDIEIPDVAHNTTDWERQVSTWHVRFGLETSYDVGAIVNELLQIDYLEPQPDWTAPSEVTVYPDGDVALFIDVGPGVEDDG